MHHERPLPPNWMAVGGYVVALAAALAAGYGAFAAPAQLREADPCRYLLPPSAVRAVGYYTPLVLGAVAVGLGAAGLRRIEAADGDLGGDWQGVFAVMLGGLAVVVGLVQVFATHVWPALPGGAVS